MRPKSKKVILIATIVLVVLFVAWIFLYHPVGGNKLADQIEETALTSNVLIMQESTYVSQGNGDPNSATSTGTAYSAGASGTIIKREGDRYYVLTAYHVIKPKKDTESREILIADYSEKAKIERGDYQKYQGLENFYNRFHKARVEFYDKNYDLAVISFVSKENYTTIIIADSLPGYGEVVGTLSNPHENARNTITIGRIVGFRTMASTLKFYGVKHPMLTHTARGSDGSSGGMVLNENLQLIGVTLGGAEIKFFAFQFPLTGKAMSCDRILDFFAENGFQI